MSTSSQQELKQSFESRTHVRYLMLALIFVVTTVNYADRATLSITGPQIRTEFGLSAIEMGFIFSAFSWSYMLSQIPGGWLLDRFGPRRVYGVSILLWSLFTFIQSAVGWVGGIEYAISSLFLMRLLVGFAEAPAFPANAKIVSAWFPVQERGTASAIFNAGQYSAAVIFTPLMAYVTHVFGWRSVYLIMGAGGMALALFWLRWAKSPIKHPKVNEAELRYIEDGGGLIRMNEDDASKATTTPQTASKTFKQIKQLLCNRMLLGINVGQFSVNVLTYFFLTWFPVYLVQERHMSILKAGFMVSLPAICGFIGGVLGGVLSDFMLRHGVSQTTARKTPIVVGMFISSSIIFCNYVDADWMIVALMALSFFGKGFGAFGWAVMADVAPKNMMGLAGAIFNTFGAVAGVVTPIVIGFILQGTGSFSGAMWFVGLNGLVTVLCYLIVVKKIERIEIR
jgi:ACS family glucarate transporter-like MFS transporter/ACS family D-galactonate transporter-like MFS transporter